MIGFLRLIGLLNAALWFGSAVLFTFGIAPATFSQEMRGVLGERFFPYFSGAIAQVLIRRYLDLQVMCGVIAAFHAMAEWLYLGRPLHRFWVGLIAGMLAIGLLGDFALQPKIRKLHAIKYAVNRTPVERDAAARSLSLWHGFSASLNLLMLGGLTLYLWRVANPVNSPVSSTRFVQTSVR